MSNLQMTLTKRILPMLQEKGLFLTPGSTASTNISRMKWRLSCQVCICLLISSFYDFVICLLIGLFYDFVYLSSDWLILRLCDLSSDWLILRFCDQSSDWLILRLCDLSSDWLILRLCASWPYTMFCLLWD